MPNQHGLKRFRRMAKIVATQIHWTKDLVKEAEEHLKTFVVPSEGDEGEVLSFNVHAFKRDIQPQSSGISGRVKSILVKNPWLRTPEELTKVYQVINHLKCFRRYSTYVKKELAKIVMFETFEQGRVVVRQGDVGFSFYFILYGRVYVEVQEVDQNTGIKMNHIVGELGPGYSFGELALINADSRRRATIVCKEDSEFLRVDKPDFDTIFKINHEKEWKMREEFFKFHPLFKKWTVSQIQHLIETSIIEEYEPGSVILKGLHRTDDAIFFVLKGRCKVIQAVKWSERSTMLPEITKSGDPSLSSHDQAKGRTKWWHVRTLTSGDYFGVGEGEASMSIITDNGKVECIKIRRVILGKYDRGRQLTHMQEEAAKLYPKLEDSYPKYIETVKWSNYKTSLVKKAAKQNKKQHPTTLKDVPKVLVLESPKRY